MAAAISLVEADELVVDAAVWIAERAGIGEFLIPALAEPTVSSSKLWMK
jgi:hypothetical protein